MWLSVCAACFVGGLLDCSVFLRDFCREGDHVECDFGLLFRRRSRRGVPRGGASPVQGCVLVAIIALIVLRNDGTAEGLQVRVLVHHQLGPSCRPHELKA